MEIPKSKIKPVSDNPRKLVIYSAPKTGKTSALAKLDNCLIIDIEKGSNFVEALKIQINNPKELYELRDEILKQGKPYKYIAVDTITALETNWAERQATINYKNSLIGKNFTGKSVLELANGGGYMWLREAMMDFINVFYSMAEHVILVGHVKVKYLTKGTEEVQALDLDLTGKIRNMICADMDAVGYIYRQEGKLMITFQNNNDDFLVGARPEHLKGKNMELDWNNIFIN